MNLLQLHLVRSAQAVTVSWVKVAVVWFLKSWNTPKARGAKIYAEVAGVGNVCRRSPSDRSHPEGLGAKLVMRNALEDAEMKPRGRLYQ